MDFQKNINYYVEGRIFEWTMGLSTLLVGAEYIIWPEVIQDSSFRYLLLFVNKDLLLLFMVTLGWTRCAALMLNGQRIFGFKMGATVRAVCSVASAMLWAQLSVALLYLSFDRGMPSPGLPFWCMFTLGETYAAYTTVKNG